MRSSRPPVPPVFRKSGLLLSLGALAPGVITSAVSAAEARPFQWSDWWLPSMHSEHGGGMDTLFVWIFWITMIALVLVQVTLVWFLVIYRHRADKRKAHFVHGNTRLEMAWTLLPAVILAVLALASKQVWGVYRYPETNEQTAHIGVVGEQFKWNVIYPGVDGKLGRYLSYPKLSDAKWPHGRRYAQVNGPRELGRAQARSQINKYINDENPLGKVYIDDPDGKDDDWQKDPTRPVLVPVNRLVEVHLGSKDVLHSFSLPNFRVKLDAVPGLQGKIHFKPLVASTSDVPVDHLTLDSRLWVDRSIPTVTVDEEGVATLPDPKTAGAGLGYLQTPKSLVQIRLAGKNVNEPTDAQLTEELTLLKADWKAAGVSTLPVIAQPFEIVCQELCGSGHGTMRGELIVLSEAQYQNHLRKNKAPDESTPPQQPNPVAAAQ